MQGCLAENVVYVSAEGHLHPLGAGRFIARRCCLSRSPHIHWVRRTRWCSVTAKIARSGPLIALLSTHASNNLPGVRFTHLAARVIQRAAKCGLKAGGFRGFWSGRAAQSVSAYVRLGLWYSVCSAECREFESTKRHVLTPCPSSSVAYSLSLGCQMTSAVGAS